MATFLLIVQTLIKDKILSFICALIPFLFDTLLYFSTEIRAYSMECLCSSAAVLAICTLHQQKCLSKIIFSSVILCILMTSRYSAMITCALSIFVITTSWLRPMSPSSLLRVSAMILPFILLAVITYIFSLSLQNPSIKTPSYVDLGFKFDALNVMILLIPPCSLFLFHRSNDRRIFAVVLYVSMLNFTYLILALLKIHPLDLESKYCIGVLWANLLFYILLFAKLLSIDSHRSRLKIAFCIIAFGILLQHRSLNMRFEQNFFDSQELCNLSDKKIFVDRSLSPTLKYLTTFGSATKWKILEENEIFFQKQIYHTLGSDRLFLGKDNVEKIDLSHYDMLIAPESIINDDISTWMKVSNYVYEKN